VVRRLEEVLSGTAETTLSLDTSSMIVEAVEAHGPEDRWELLRRQRDIQVKGLRKLQELFYGLVVRIVMDLTEGKLLP
jgi:hypothetical protein